MTYESQSFFEAWLRALVRQEAHPPPLPVFLARSTSNQPFRSIRRQRSISTASPQREHVIILHRNIELMCDDDMRKYLQIGHEGAIVCHTRNRHQSLVDGRTCNGRRSRNSLAD